MPARGVTPGQAAMMIEKIRADHTLPAVLRTRVTRILTTASQPGRAIQKLQEVALDELPRIPRTAPTRDLSRVVSAATFWRYMSRPEVRDTFLTAEDFARYIDTSTDPSGALREALSDGPILFEWQRSWLAETDELRPLNAQQLQTGLELSYGPPLVVFDLSLEALLRDGVTVRKPNSLDSVLGPNPQWRPGGPVSGLREFVDWSIPLTCLKSIVWKPI